MNEEELLFLINQLDDDLDEELKGFFNNSILYEYFKELINLTVFDDNSFDDEIIGKIDSLTDNMDEFNFKDVKDNIKDLKELLQN
ncbi:MAG: hypothetical protein BZ137_02190 [Methanosphaera sp. rholeuAM130]|nr:MAG: hypothetical protein BZ137_02190 [Methanosphaera sp. rholeuAM130]